MGYANSQRLRYAVPTKHRLQERIRSEIRSDTTTNEVTFSSTTGASADEVTLDLDPMLTPLETLNAAHTTDIDDFKLREQFKKVTQHPDLTDSQMNNGTFHSSNTRYDFSINGTDYGFANSSSESTNYHYKAFQSNTDFWESNNSGGRKFETANGAYFDYSGGSTLSGFVGEWLRIGPDTITTQPGYILNSFSMQANSSKSKPRSFKICGSDTPNGGYVLLGEYNDVVVSSSEPTNFKLDTSLPNYGTPYTHYFISITKIDAYSTERTVAIQHLKFFSVSKDVSDIIAQNTTNSTEITTLTNDITNILAREQFKNITKHPDLTDAMISADSVTVNGRNYVFSQSSYESSNYGRNAFTSSDYWETENSSDHNYSPVSSAGYGNYYDYSGTSSLGYMKIPVGVSRWTQKYERTKYGFYEISNLKFSKKETLRPICTTDEQGRRQWANKTYDKVSSTTPRNSTSCTSSQGINQPRTSR